jgi:hypothetical protein
MPPPSPRHLGEHRTPWRLMLVALGLTLAVAAAMVASTAFVPDEPARSSGVRPIPPPTTVPPLPTGPAPSSASTGPSAVTIEPGPQHPPGIAPTTAGVQGPTTTVRPAKPRPTRPTRPPPPSAPDPSKPVAPTTTEPPPTTTTTGLATPALHATTTTEQPVR